MKVLFGMPLHQTAVFIQSLRRLVGLDWAAPDFQHLIPTPEGPERKPAYRGSKGPLSLLIDSTGTKAEGALSENACSRMAGNGRFQTSHMAQDTHEHRRGNPRAFGLSTSLVAT